MVFPHQCYDVIIASLVEKGTWNLASNMYFIRVKCAEIGKL